MELHSYPKIYNFGHKELEGFFDDEVVVEEKIDGSQFSFGLIDGQLIVRSKGQHFDVNGPEKMFTAACETVREIASILEPGWVYRCEYLSKPKHNTLAYDRIPAKTLIIYDIERANQDFLPYIKKMFEANRLGLECVPILFQGKVESYEHFKELLETVSCLGGQKIEGVVVKNYKRFGGDKKVLMAKYVSEAFKEIHKKDWKLRHPGSKDIKETIADSLRTEARWNKAVQHLQERGVLTNSPKDIGELLKEISIDTLAEAESYIRDELWKWAWKDISRMMLRGVPQWYKDKLAKSQFETDGGSNDA